jgi:hypothetical protein
MAALMASIPPGELMHARDSAAHSSISAVAALPVWEWAVLPIDEVAVWPLSAWFVRSVPIEMCSVPLPVPEWDVRLASQTSKAEATTRAATTSVWIFIVKVLRESES